MAKKGQKTLIVASATVQDGKIVIVPQQGEPVEVAKEAVDLALLTKGTKITVFLNGTVKVVAQAPAEQQPRPERR